MIATPGFPKRNEGRDEAIVAPEIPIVDSHHHIFDRPALRYLFDSYNEDVALGHRIVATVYIETQAMARTTGPEVMRALGEVEFAAGIGAMADSGIYGPCRVGASMVGFADMTLGAGIAPFLDAAMAMAPDRFRGVRQIALAHPDPAVLRFLTHKPPQGLLESAPFHAALTEIGARDLSFDVTVLHTQLPELCAVLKRHESTRFVLDHMGLAIALDRTPDARRAAFEDWRTNMAALARHDNIVCKVGGLGTSYWGFSEYMREAPVSTADLVTAWRPYVETVMELFGAERCLAESNFPNDGRTAGFVPLWNALKTIVRDCSKDEIGALFHGTAIRTYRMTGVDIPDW